MRSLSITSLLLLLATVVGSCSTSNLPSGRSSQREVINLASALTIRPGESTKAQVEKIFGAPGSLEIKKGFENWTYFSPNTETQRLTVAFRQESGVVESVLWVPSDYLEGKMSAVQAMFPKSKFEAIEPEQNQHFIVSDITYLDQERRVMILSRKDSDHANAIAWRIPVARVPTAEK